MRKAGKISFIAVFCAAIGLTFPVFNVFSKQLSMDSHENRLMTGLPQVLQSPISQLPRSLDNFFDFMISKNRPFFRMQPNYGRFYNSLYGKVWKLN